MVGGKLKAAILVVLALTTLNTIEWYYVGEGVLLGAIAYPDGSAVDITLRGSEMRFTAIMPDGMTHVTSLAVSCGGGIDEATVRANGRAVHVIAVESSCGVEHYRYWIPGGMSGLNSVSIFAPIIVR